MIIIQEIRYRISAGVCLLVLAAIIYLQLTGHAGGTPYNLLHSIIGLSLCWGLMYGVIWNFKTKIFGKNELQKNIHMIISCLLMLSIPYLYSIAPVMKGKEYLEVIKIRTVKAMPDQYYYGYGDKYFKPLLISDSIKYKLELTDEELQNGWIYNVVLSRLRFKDDVLIDIIKKHDAL